MFLRGADCGAETASCSVAAARRRASADAAGKHRRRTRLSGRGLPFVEDQAVEIVDELGACDLCFGACDADGVRMNNPI